MNEKTFKDYLERVKKSFDTEFTQAEKLSCSGNCDGTLHVFEIYAEDKHPEDTDFIDNYVDYFDEDWYQELEDEYLDYFMNTIDEIESQLTDEEFEEITNDYYSPKTDFDKFEEIMLKCILAAPEFRREITSEDQEMVAKVLRSLKKFKNQI